MLSGIDGVLLVVVVGEGKLVVPVDFAIRRPDPTGPGAPCRDKLHWVQGMLDGRVAAFRRCGVALPPPLVVADSWFGDSKLIRHVATIHGGTLLVEGKSTYVFALADGRQVKGRDLQQPSDWPWRDSLRLMGCLVLFYASRVICKGQLTMEELIFSLKHYWRFVDSEALELTALSQGVGEKAA